MTACKQCGHIDANIRRFYDSFNRVTPRIGSSRPLAYNANGAVASFEVQAGTVITVYLSQPAHWGSSEAKRALPTTNDVRIPAGIHTFTVDEGAKSVGFIIHADATAAGVASLVQHPRMAVDDFP